MRVLAWLAIAVACGIAAPAAGEPAPPLALETTIPLLDVAGRIDHLAIDLARMRLFIAELGNGTVDVIDLKTKKIAHRFRGLDEPQGIAYLPAHDLLVVACGGDGKVLFFAGSDFSNRGALDLGDDADNVRVDARHDTVLVGYGSGAFAVINPQTRKVIANIRLPAHPEGFQISPAWDRVYVNIPDAHEIAVVDLSARKLLGEWKTANLAANFPMSLDDSVPSIAVVFRRPPRLQVFDATNGEPKAAVATCGDADDVFFDAKRERLYVSCGAGMIDTFVRTQSGLAHLGSTPTKSGARTALFVPELDRLFLAVPADWFGSNAAVRIYRPGTDVNR